MTLAGPPPRLFLALEDRLADRPVELDHASVDCPVGLHLGRADPCLEVGEDFCVVAGKD